MNKKMIWAILLVSVLTVVGAYWISFSNSPVVAVTTVATGDYVSAVGLTFLTASIATILVASWEKDEEELSTLKFFFLSAIFLLALNPVWGTSRYHNLIQIERDKTIVETMEVRQVNGQMELGLPKEMSAKEQNYLKQVLTVIVGKERHLWREAIRCQEGPTIWYKLVVEPTSETVSFKFNHLWWDYGATKKLPPLPLP